MAFGDNSPADQTQAVSVLQNVVVAINELTLKVEETFPNWVTAPANSTASGVAGQVAFSGSATSTAYIFVCLTSGAAGTAHWGRALLTTSGW